MEVNHFYFSQIKSFKIIALSVPDQPWQHLLHELYRPNPDPHPVAPGLLPVRSPRLLLPGRQGAVHSLRSLQTFPGGFNKL